MKSQIIFALPAALLFAGCSAPANDSANSNISNTSVPASTPAVAPKPTAVKAAAPNPSATKTGATKSAATKTGAPDPKYKVVSEGDPQMPSEILAGLEKAKVPPPPQSMTVPKSARVTMSTSKGMIVVELNGQAAPLHVKSFLYLAGRGFYNGTVFHRFADLLEGSGGGKTGRIIQGGDPLSKDPKLKPYAGAGGPGYQIPREHNALKHDKMVIAAARSQDPDSAGSQFYFTLDPVPFLDEGDGYTVFGKVLSGQSVVLKLRAGDKLNKVTVAPLPKK